MRMRAPKVAAGKVFILLALTLWTVVSILPFYFMAISSLKGRFEILTNGVFTLPKQINIANYAEVLKGGFLLYLMNSVITVGLSLLLIVIVGASASYVFSRLRFRLNKYIFGLIVSLMSIPVYVTLIPIFILTKKLGIYDLSIALIGPYVAFNLPISIFILTGFMRVIPKEIEEAAEIDGCGKTGIFSRVIFPLSIPGITTIAIYNGVLMWNEFPFAAVLTQTIRSQTLPLAVWEFQGQYASNITMIMTVLTLSTLPMIAAFIFGQDKLISGMMAGAVKG